MIKLFRINFNKDIFIITIGNLIRIFLVIAYTRLMTYFLNYEELSKYYLIFSIYTFFSYIIIGSIGLYINRKTLEWVEDKTLIDALISLFKKLLIPITLAAFLIVFLYTIVVYNSVNYSIVICLLVGSLIIFKTSNETIYPIFNLLNLNYQYIRFLIIFNILNLALSSVFVSFFDVKFQYWMLGLITSNFLIAIMSWRSLNIHLKKSKKSNINYFEIFSFSSNIILGHTLIWFLTDGFRFIAEQKFNSYDLGILLLGLSLATQIFSIVDNILNQLLYPKYLDKISNSNFETRSEAFNSFLSKILPVVMSTAIFVFLSTNEVLKIIVDSSKLNKELIYIFKIGIGIEFLRILINILKQITISEYKTSKIVFPYMLGVVLFLIGIFVIDNTLSDFPFLLLLSYSLITSLSLLSFNKIIKITFNYQKLIKLKLTLMPVFICLIFFNNTISFVLCGLFFSLVLYQFINKDFINETN